MTTFAADMGDYYITGRSRLTGEREVLTPYCSRRTAAKVLAAWRRSQPLMYSPDASWWADLRIERRGFGCQIDLNFELT